MSFSFNGLQASVTISGGMSMPTLSSSQSIINVNIGTTAAVQTIYSVPAGYRFNLYGYGTLTQVGWNDESVKVFKTDGSTQIGFTQYRAAGAGYGLNYNPVTSAVPIWVYAAGELVKVQGNHNDAANTFIYVFGILEAV